MEVAPLTEEGYCVLVLVVYDVSTVDTEGQKRLRQVAKYCETHGIRVQDSVFECSVDNAQYAKMRHHLEKLIDGTSDSVRLYNLGNSWQNKIERLGVKEQFQSEGTWVL